MNASSPTRTLSPACSCCGDLLTAPFSRRRFLQAAAAGAAFSAGMPTLATAGEGNYEAMLLACIDPRFPKATLDYMQSRNLVGKYSQFNIAGAAIGTVAPAFKAWHETFWQNLEASIQLHRIPRVIAIDHRDCGAAKIAYGAERVASRQIETDTHRAAMLAFRDQVRARHPKLEVELGLMALDGTVETFS